MQEIRKVHDQFDAAMARYGMEMESVPLGFSTVLHFFEIVNDRHSTLSETREK